MSVFLPTCRKIPLSLKNLFQLVSEMIKLKAVQNQTKLKRDSFTEFFPCSFKMNSNWYFTNFSHEHLQISFFENGMVASFSKKLKHLFSLS